MHSTNLATASRLNHTIKRQAKRLQSRLDIQLHQARRILAQGVYHCANWEDLETRLTDGRLHSEALLLAHLPESAAAKLYLREHIQEIARSVGRLVLTNQNLVGMIGVLWFVFEERNEQAELSDAVRALQALPWYTTNIATDPHAVVQAYANINGVPMKLVGTRVYLPQYMNMGDELNSIAHHAVNIGTPFEIMWSDPEAWHAVATAYLSDPDDGLAEIELDFPRAKLNKSMRAHERWFRRVLAEWPHITEYREYDEAEFVPLIAPSGCYLVFGFPTSLESAFEAPAQIEPMNLAGMCGEDERTLALVHGLPLCIQWSARPSDIDSATGSHADLDHAVFSHPDCDVSVLRLSHTDAGVFFVHPASDWDIRRYMQLRVAPSNGKAATVIKTDNIELTDKILGKIAKRELTRHVSNNGFEHYVMVLNISGSKELRCVSLVFNLYGEKEEHWSSLISTAMWESDKIGNFQVILELNDRIFVLFEKLGKEAVLDAALNGIVLHGTQSLDNAIDQVPRWCRQLPPTPPPLIALLEDRYKSIEPHLLFDLWRHVRIPKYLRDNY